MMVVICVLSVFGMICLIVNWDLMEIWGESKEISSCLIRFTGNSLSMTVVSCVKVTEGETWILFQRMLVMS